MLYTTADRIKKAVSELYAKLWDECHMRGIYPDEKLLLSQQYRQNQPNPAGLRSGSAEIISHYMVSEHIEIYNEVSGLPPFNLAPECKTIYALTGQGSLV